MTNVTRSPDCGNSPKNIFIEKLTIAFAKGNSKFILRSVTDDIRWNIVGDRVIEGKDNFAEALERMNKGEVVELTMHHIATHGKAGAVNGTVKWRNRRPRAFCDIYEFGNARGTSVQEITSYVIEI